MKKFLTWILVFISASLFALTGTLKTQCLAADTYTVTFRAGNVGTFLTDSVTETESVHVTENYIKVEVAEGSSIAQVIAELNGTAQTSADLDYFFRQITNVKNGYLLLNESKWGPAVSDTVEENEDYVLDYGTLVDPIEYKIQYVDSKTGDAVASALISYGNEGDVVAVEPITITGYNTQAKKQSLTLKKNSTNQLSFKYAAENQDETGTTVVQEVPGNTIVNTQTRITYAADNGNNMANVNNPAGAGGGANAGGNGDNNAGGNENAENTDIQDDGVPLSDGTVKGDDKKSKTIEDEDTPSSDGDKEDTEYSYLKTVLPGILGMITTAVVVTLLIRKRKKKLLEKTSKKDG